MHLKKIFFVSFLFLSSGVITCCDKTKQTELVVGISPDYPPFTFEHQNKLIGFEIDLINAVAARLDSKITFKKMNFTELFNALEEKKVDLIISAISRTPDRLAKFDFGGSYYQPSFALLFKKEKLKEIVSIEHLTVPIGLEKGTTMEIYINDLSQKNTVDNNNLVQTPISENESSEEKNTNITKSTFNTKLYDKNTELLSSLKKDEIGAILIEALEAEIIVQNNRNFSYIPVPKKENTDYSYGIVFPKNSKLTTKFTSAINEIESEGKIGILEMRWFSRNGMYSDLSTEENNKNE